MAESRPHVDRSAMDVSGKRVAVIGATGAIGGAVCRELVSRGASVLGTGRDSERLRELHDAGMRAVPLDLSSASMAAQDFQQACMGTFPGGLDGLVFASGDHGPIGPTRALDPTDLSAYLDQHLASIVGLLAAAAPLLDKSESPSVVLLSGGGATAPRANYTPYALAKVGVVRLAENVALEEPSWRVNAVAPGFVASRIHDSTIAAGKGRSGEDPNELRHRLSSADPPERAAGCIRFLLSDAAKGITGRLISAIWDPWEDSDWRQAVASSESLGRLRRIDGMQFGGLARR